jgi:ribose/xylose/arabinose/galactoside ABC-type transport system permease subunit
VENPVACPEATTEPVRTRWIALWLAVGLIGALAGVLLPSWGWDRSVFWPAETDGEWLLHVRNVLDRSVNELASFYLLPAMGLWLALRCRAIDLSVWAVAGLGGVLAAVLVNAGLPPLLAMACATAAGLAVGLVNGLLVARTPLPSALVTLATGLLTMLVAQGLASGRAVRVPDDRFGPWLLREPVIETIEQGSEETESDEPARPARRAPRYVPRPPSVTRMLLVAGTYSVTMLLLVLWGVLARHDRGRRLSRARRLLALTASGALAAAAGTFWVVEHNSAPVPTRLVGDLRVPAAALLAGGILLVGPGRTLLSGLFLPASVFLATAWRQEIPGLPGWRSHGYAVQSLLLAAMALSIGVSFIRCSATSGSVRAVSGICCVGAVLGLVLVAAQVLPGAPGLARALHLVGLAIWLGAAGALLLAELTTRIVRRRGR